MGLVAQDTISSRQMTHGDGSRWLGCIGLYISLYIYVFLFFSRYHRSMLLARSAAIGTRT